MSKERDISVLTFLLGLVGAFCATAAIAAVTYIGSPGITWSDPVRTPDGTHTIYKATVQAGTAGTATGGVGMEGYLERVVVDPQWSIRSETVDTTTTVTTFGWPLASFSISMKDRHGIPIYATAGALNFLSTTAQERRPYWLTSTYLYEPWMQGDVTLDLAAMGTYRMTDVYFYVRSKK